MSSGGRNQERAAGGFSQRDGTVAFYQRINALIRPDMTVLDFGAGRGSTIGDENVSYGARLARLKGKVQRVIGIDVDPVVAENTGLDEAHVIKVGESLPFADATFDLIYADWVLEHIEDPASFAAEISRILKPGGWFCARTPNRWGYIALAASLIPEALHGRVLARVQSKRQEFDVFPKFYRLNTLGAIQQSFPADRFLNASYMHNADPAYFGNSRLLYAGIEAFQSLPMCKTTILAFAQKVSGSAS